MSADEKTGRGSPVAKALNARAEDKASRRGIYLLLLGSMALWGGTWPVGRALAGSVSPCNAALVRFVMATLVLLFICWRTTGWQRLRFPGTRLHFLSRYAGPKPIARRHALICPMCNMKCPPT